MTLEKVPEKESETGYFEYTLGFLGKRGVAFYHTPCLLPEGKGIYVKDIDVFSLVRCRKRKTCLKKKRGFPNGSKPRSIYLWLSTPTGSPGFRLIFAHMRPDPVSASFS